MSPETIFQKKHSYASDFFSLGVICYEMIMRKRPYTGKNRQEIKRKMASDFVQIKKSEIPEGWSQEFVDFTNKLLEKNVETRLGYKGINELKSHPFLKLTDWKDLYLMKEKPHFVPPKKVITSDEEIKEEPKSMQKPIISDICKTAFKDFLYFNKYSKNQDKNDLTRNDQFNNPHSFYEEVDKKEEKFKNIVLKMDEELKKEKEKIKERESHRRKSVGVTKNINLNNRIFDKRRNSNVEIEKDDFLKQAFNPIRIKVRKQSLV